MGSKKPRTFIFIRTRGIEINGQALPDLDVDTEVREGEDLWGAIGRAHAERQQAKAAPASRKRVRAKVVKRLPKAKGGGDAR